MTTYRAITIRFTDPDHDPFTYDPHPSLIYVPSADDGHWSISGPSLHLAAFLQRILDANDLADSY